MTRADAAPDPDVRQPPTCSHAARRRRWALCVVAAALAYTAACDREPMAPSSATSPRASAADVPRAAACWIGVRPSPAGVPPTYGEQTYFGLRPPVSDTTCGLRWSMSTPTLNYDQQWTFFFDESTPLETGRNRKFCNSTNCSRQEGPLTITFDRPIKSLTVTLQAVDLPGHYMEAFDAAGARVDSVAFLYSGQQYPYENQFDDVQTLAAAGITRVVIHAPIWHDAPTGAGAVEYVWYWISYEPDDCHFAPDDWILEQRAVRQQLTEQLALSRQEDLERSGWIYRDDVTGDYVVYHFEGLGRTACNSYTGIPQPQAGYTALYSWHTHPRIAGSAPPGCAKAPGTRLRSGPSIEDLAALASINGAGGSKMYIMEPGDLISLDVDRSWRSYRHQNPVGCRWL